jgi:transcriptional regulator with XRE-family HTH domain
MGEPRLSPRFVEISRLHRQVSAARCHSPHQVLTIVSALSGIPLDALQSPSQVRKLGPVRAAAAHLLRVDSGLEVKQVGPLLGRSDQTICELSRNARKALDHGGVIAELIKQAKQVLDASEPSFRPASAEPARPARVRPPSAPRAVPVPQLARWRVRTGLTQPELARRSGVARETIARLEHGRAARRDVILRLADALVLAQSQLTGGTALDPLTGKEYLRCKSCPALRPARIFVQVKGTPYFYLRCRLCRAKRARERYHAEPAERAAQLRRVQRNRLRRRQAAA